MQAHLANLIHPVLAYGLDLRDRLVQDPSGELVDGELADRLLMKLDQQQTALKDLLLVDVDAQRWTDYGGEGKHSIVPREEKSVDAGRHDATGRFLGIRYALVCWLDELFSSDTPWATRWNEQKLEVEMYGSNDRAWRFWEQAELAARRPTDDALEAFYLCVMLGFRGQYREQDEKLQAWTANARRRLGIVEEPAWPYAFEVEPPRRTAPLTGRLRFERMAFTAWLALLALIPLSAFWVVFRLGQ